ncbi:tripartite motif-containing protein 12A-like isoform X2 [Lethenteron reissneri]|uniref:tripartite motif-containing protein 12A-like isoform X2 n=1 Tax=Lethenteron reissneri TaxID=7753 RepID=UPI002AB6FA2B|nr:tripartite motif-containing protein 12A-like isoform X2 [Lethenteron reissneri]
MASSSSSQEDDFSCSICLQLFDIPVSLACGHNFCKKCVERAWDAEAAHVRFTCPQCRRRYAQKPELSKNVFIADLVEKFKSSRKSQCCDHKEPMRYYCQTHARLVCETCMLAGGHKGCDAFTVKKQKKKKKETIAGENRRMKKEKTTEENSVTSLKNSLKSFQDLTENVKDRIVESFALDRRLLDEEEQEALDGVQEESRQELSRIQNKIAGHVNEIGTLIEDIVYLEKMMALQDPIAYLNDDQVTSRLIKFHIEECHVSSRPPEKSGIWQRFLDVLRSFDFLSEDDPIHSLLATAVKYLLLWLAFKVPWLFSNSECSLVSSSPPNFQRSQNVQTNPFFPGFPKRVTVTSPELLRASHRGDGTGRWM